MKKMILCLSLVMISNVCAMDRRSDNSANSSVIRNYGDFLGIGSVLLGTTAFNNSQVSALRRAKAKEENPKVKALYEQGIQNVKTAATTTSWLNCLTVGGVIISRLCNLDPYLTVLAAALSVGSCYFVNQEKNSTEVEAEILKNNLKNNRDKDEDEDDNKRLDQKRKNNGEGLRSKRKEVAG